MNAYPIYCAPAPDEKPGYARAHGKSLTGKRGVYKRDDRYVARFARNGIEHHMQYFDTIAAAHAWVLAMNAILPVQGAIPPARQIAA